MRGSKVRVCMLAACLVAGLLGVSAAPAAADPTNITIAGITVDGVTPTYDTGISTTCARTGTGPGTNVNGHWSNVAHGYSIATADPGALDCFHDITDFLKFMALHEEDFSATAPQVLRSSLLTGTVNLSKPYEVFLDNIYISTVVLGTLDANTAPADTGLGSCGFSDYMLLITCADNALGTVMLRDDWGNPIRDWANNPVTFNLNGILSQRGGTTYGNVFVTNTDANGAQFFDARVEHHEQVHSQQWSQWGWDFARRYAQDFVDSAGNANYNYWLYGRTQGIFVPAQCYQQFEKMAGFQDGGYAFRDPAHGGPTSVTEATLWGTKYVPNGQAYPANWNDSLNTAWGNKCPATWQPN